MTVMFRSQDQQAHHARWVAEIAAAREAAATARRIRQEYPGHDEIYDDVIDAVRRHRWTAKCELRASRAPDRRRTPSRGAWARAFNTP